MKKIFSPVVMKLLIGVFLIMVFTLWTYYPSTNNTFVWDSKGYVLAYEFWISKLHPYHIVWMFQSLEFYNWHPLTWLSWAIDYQLYGGLSAWGFHLSNNILHALNSVLVFVLTLVIFGLSNPKLSGYPFRKDTNALVAAFLAALLFAVHPQHVESVAWIAERKDLLCQLFLLLSLLTYVNYVTCHENIKSRWFNITLGLFVLALLSKPMAVTFPVVLLLVDAYPLRRFNFVSPLSQSIRQESIYSLLREKFPFFLLTIALILITLFAQKGALANVSFDLRVLNAFNSVILYLTKLFIPLNFASQYPYFVDVGENIDWKAFLPILGVFGVTLAALFAWIRGHHAWLISWLFYLVTLSPVLGLIQVGAQGSADRYAYWPTLPVYLLIGAGILLLLNKTANKMRLVIVLATLPVVLFLVGETRRQIQVWENDLTLWSNAIKLYPNNDLAHLSMGQNYFGRQNWEKAAYHFSIAGKLRPNEARTYAWRALTYTLLDQYQEALNFHVKLGSAFESNPELKADQYCIQYNIGWLFAKMEMFEESSELFSRVNPSSPFGYDARIWLNWLEHENKIENEKLSTEELPRFCTKLLSSM